MGIKPYPLPFSKRLRFFINYFIGPLLFLLLGFSIYSQIKNQKDWQQQWLAVQDSFEKHQSWLLYVVVFLMLVNWGIEAKKWQLILRHLKQISFINAFKSVLSGVAFTMLTPNRMGEFIGRVFYIEEGQRIRGAMLTIVGSISQMIITLLAGNLGLMFLLAQPGLQFQTTGLNLFWIKGLLFVTTSLFVLLLLFYYRISWLARAIGKIQGLKKYAYFIELLDSFNAKELFVIMGLSALRFVVFVAQYMLLFYLFGVQLPMVQGCAAVAVLFLILAVVPTIALAELGIRGKVSLALFGLMSSNAFGILVTTGSIWLINIILPAVLGSLLILNVKLFTKKEEHL